MPQNCQRKEVILMQKPGLQMHFNLPHIQPSEDLNFSLSGTQYLMPNSNGKTTIH